MIKCFFPYFLKKDFILSIVLFVEFFLGNFPKLNEKVELRNLGIVWVY